MFEAGWLLLFLFLGLCSLVVVAVLWPSFRNDQHFNVADEAHVFRKKAPSSPKTTKLVNTAWAVKPELKKALRYTGWWIAQLGQENVDESTDALIFTFSVEEIGKIAVSIVQQAERAKAIRSMPRYNRKHHQAFAAFFDQLKKAMSEATPEK